MTGRKHIAVILSRFPFPLDKGDKLRAYHQLKYLSTKFDIHLFALHESQIEKAHEKEVAIFCKTITLYKLSTMEKYTNAILSSLKKQPVQVGYFYASRIKKQMQQDLNRLKPDLIYGQLSRTALYFNDLPFTKIIDFQDAFSTNYARIETYSSGLKKWFYRREGKLMKTFEEQMQKNFDACTIISSFDKSKILDEENKITVVSNGVDINYFTASNEIKKSSDILFLGNLSYLPNKQAALYLVEKIAPLLIKKLPNVKIKLAGAEPKELIKLQSKTIEVTGWIEDIRIAYQSTKIFVAPLFTGAGLQNKLLEAMCMGIPCITTSIANSSLNAIENEQVLLAENETEFVNHIICLLQDEALQNKLRVNARQFIEKNYSWEAANKPLGDLFSRFTA